MATNAPLQTVLHNFENFITNCTPEQITNLNEAIKAIQRQNAATSMTKAATSMTAKAGVKKQKKVTSKKATIGVANAMSAASSIPVAIVPVANSGGTVSAGPKRPLNSFMGFRKYYSPYLAPYTQKQISKMITTLWHADPHQARWAVVAKAYSTLRGDRTKEEVPLDEFLVICLPMMGIIPADKYLQVTGWTIGPPKHDDPEKIPQLTRIAVPGDIPNYGSITSSVTDLISRCHAVGFAVPKPKSTPAYQPNAVAVACGALTMAVNPTPTNPPREEVLASCEGENNTLANTSLSLNNTGATYPFNDMFDPTADFDITFNPAVTDDTGPWDAYNADEVISSGNDLDWNDFINDFNPVSAGQV